MKYNHDSTTAFFKGTWFASWNGNTNPNEGQPSQLNYVATSTDFKSWSAPVAAYSDPEYSINPVSTKQETIQWQPNFVVVNDELWSVWSIDHGEKYDKAVYLSKLTDPAGKWENSPILIDNSTTVNINSDEYILFPTQNPIVLSTGRVLVPVVAEGPGEGFFGQIKKTAVL